LVCITLQKDWLTDFSGYSGATASEFHRLLLTKLIKDVSHRTSPCQWNQCWSRAVRQRERVKRVFGTNIMATRLTMIAQGATAASRRAAFPSDEALEPGALDGLSAPRLWRDARVRLSPMRAASQTAQGLGLIGGVDKVLADADFGEWSGQTVSEVATTQPVLLERWITDPDFSCHGGESRAALRVRAQHFLQACAATTGQTVAVTHAAIVRAVIIEVFEAPDAAYWKLDIAPLSMTDMRHDGRRWALRQMGLPLTCAQG
jgi:broad specificity phosphatase PhoE